MRSLIIAAMLLALAAPAHASAFRKSDRKWMPAINRYVELAIECRHASDENDPPCKAAEKAGKKLEAAGYCRYANADVGRPSRDRKHCYEIDFPEHP